jgi:hypothetical protein
LSGSEFYVGYKSEAPPRLARFLRLVVGSLLLGGALLAVTLATQQKLFDPGQFEFGVIREFEGVLLENPVPTLLTAAPEDSVDGHGYARYLLVSPGKFGAEELVSGLHGKTVQAQGSLIHREGEAMIELVPGSIREAAAGAGPQLSPAIDLGSHTLIGEIVDAKCYLGVMKPGREKTHRACAVRCISGGIPPILRSTTADGKIVHLLLVGIDGDPIHEQILEFVAEPVEIPGTIQRLGEQLVFLVDPDSIRRLAD